MPPPPGPATPLNRSPEFHGAQNHCFGCGQANPSGLKLHFTILPAPSGPDENPSNPIVFCTTQLTDHYEGPPGYLHGGIIATLLDEVMSKANRARGITAMTRNMQVDYLRPVPSNTLIHIEGRVTRSQGRKHFTEARITLPRSENTPTRILAQATALFIAIERP